MRVKLTVLLTLSLAMSCAVAQAAVVTSLLKTDDPAPGAPGNTIYGLNNTATDGPSAYAVAFNSSGTAGTLSHVWGNLAGGAGVPLRMEATYDTLEQTSFESFFGIGADLPGMAYSAVCTHTVSGATGLDAVFRNDSVVTVEDAPYPHEPGYYWTFGSRAGMTAGGAPYWVGGITDSYGGSTTNRGLFYGLGATPLLLGGDSVPGVADPLSTSSTVSFDYRFSRHGTQNIAEVTTTAPSTANHHMVLSGSGLQLDNQPVYEGWPVPASIGGLPSENWDNFDYCGITDDGTWFFSGDTDHSTALDEIVVYNGTIRYREGDTVDGETLTGAIEGAYLNEDGDLAMIWDIVGGTGSLEALFFDSQLIAVEGDAIDIDGDLIPDPGAVIENFSGISTLSLSDRDGNGNVAIYFTADVEVTRGGRMPAPVERLPESLVARAADGLSAEDVAQVEADPRGESRLSVECFCRVIVSVPPASAENEPLRGADSHLTVVPSIVAESQSQIHFRLAAPRQMAVTIYDLAGRSVRTIAAGSFAAGPQSLVWDGRDAVGTPVPAGVYLVRLDGDPTAAAQRVTVLR